MKRYFKRDVRADESELGAGTFWIEFDDEYATRQVEQYGGRWFSSREDYHEERGLGLADQPLSELGFTPDDEISRDEFERVWDESGAEESEAESERPA